MMRSIMANIRAISLVVLTVQNSALALVLRLSKTRTPEDNYLSSTAIVNAELLKAVVCFAVVSQTEVGQHPTLKQVRQAFWQCFGDRYEILKILVPSLLYLIQNSLQFYAISQLQAATFQVMCQLKILTTAVFTIVLLGRKISLQQWLALLVLMSGVVTVQLSTGNASSKATTAGQHTLRGLLAILLACCCSGFAGVYTEKILKTSPTSLWIRNVQMGVLSFFVGLLGIALSPQERLVVHEKGFYHGYSPIVWLAVLLQGLGGLVTAVVVKYADNIIKSFATSLAVVLSAVLSIFLFQVYPTANFVLGAALVNLSVFLYNTPDKLEVYLGRAKPVYTPLPTLAPTEISPTPMPLPKAVLNEGHVLSRMHPNSPNVKASS